MTAGVKSLQKNWLEFHCEELFIVKHKSKYSCESAIYFNFNTDTIKENCNFKFYYNKTDISPVVLNGRNEIMCNCGIQADDHYLLESLAECDNINSKLIMYFTINTAFANYLDMFPNLTESLELPIIKNRTTFEQILPVSLNISKFDNTLLTASTDLKEFYFQLH